MAKGPDNGQSRGVKLRDENGDGYGVKHTNNAIHTVIANGLSFPVYDKIEIDKSGELIDVYTFKKSGSQVSILTLTYSDITKEILISVQQA